jgi:hypothetical protein
MSDVVGSADVAHCLAGLDPRKRLDPLMWCQLRLAAHPHAPRLRPGPTLAGAGQDQLALKLGQAAQHRQQQAAVWRGRVGPGVTQRAKPGFFDGDRRQSVQQVARGAGQAIEPRHHHHIARHQAVDEPAQLRPVRLRPTGDFPEDLLAAGGRQLVGLRLHALAVRRHPRIPVNHVPIVHRIYAPEKPRLISSLVLVQNS